MTFVRIARRSDTPRTKLAAYRAQRRKFEMSDLNTALRSLNKAAYDAIRAGQDTTLYPDLDRQSLRVIARMTDDLVDDHAIMEAKSKG